MRAFFHGLRLRNVIGVMSTRIAIRNICRGLYSGLRGAISPGGAVHYEGVFHGMRLRDVIGVMSIRIAIRDICRGLYSGLRVAISSGGGVHYEGVFHGMGEQQCSRAATSRAAEVQTAVPLQRCSISVSACVSLVCVLCAVRVRTW
jgi:hypothetical protein